PLEEGLKSVSLSANWMWPCNNEGEDARLYSAVKALSDYAVNLGINIPTGKDSLSMKQKYRDKEVAAPGTVIISAAGQCSDIKKVVEPVLQKDGGAIYYINFSQDHFKLGGSSFGQIRNKIGREVPGIRDDDFVVRAFNIIQKLIADDLILAGHDVASGGLITTILEMCFPENNLSANFDFSELGEEDSIKLLFSENPGLFFQAKSEEVEKRLEQAEVDYFKVGEVTGGSSLHVKNGKENFQFDIEHLRDLWFETSYLLDQKQSGKTKAGERYENYKKIPLEFRFPKNFTGKIDHSAKRKADKVKAAIIREKGSNSEREMAQPMHLAGFEVKDIHMTDLTSGREDLKDVRFIAAVGGFSNSDVLGSAKGWAGAFLYNQKAHRALHDFFSRQDTLTLGV